MKTGLYTTLDQRVFAIGGRCYPSGTMRVPAVLAALLVTVTMGCGGANGTSPPGDRAKIEEPADIASSDPQVKYFHEQLVAYGDDQQSDFGGDLTALGLAARDLQQDDPKHAYDEVLAKVLKVQDATTRREMMRTLFNRAE